MTSRILFINDKVKDQGGTIGPTVPGPNVLKGGIVYVVY